MSEESIRRGVDLFAAVCYGGMAALILASLITNPTPRLLLRAGLVGCFLVMALHKAIRAAK